jgi:hypothetical protein
MSLDGFDLTRQLAGLKDFQRHTVDYVARRMWLDEPAVTRFLVADEVGLGKTMIARGVIARTIEHLRDTVDRIDVVYVCSNAAIAQQNVARLNVLGHQHVSMATRLTLLPQHLHRLEENRVNFVSFTPGTTFDLKSSGGIVEERVVLYRILVEALPGLRLSLPHLLRCGAGLERFERCIASATAPLNTMLVSLFVTRLREDTTLLEQLHDAADRFRRPCRHSAEDVALQYFVAGRLRQLLARVCVDALEPDLVILDEFQRFRDLLDGETDAAELARLLMEHRTPEGHDVRVLLLSATPYKPLTMGDEEDDHYGEFLRTVGFLLGDEGRLARLEEDLRIYRSGLYANGDGAAEINLARGNVERSLRSVMVRTERVRRTASGDAMLVSQTRPAPLTVEDLEQARLLDEVAVHVDAGNAVEYWKSAPYLLQFMKDYQLKRKLRGLADDPPEALVRAVSTGRSRMLAKRRVSRFEELDASNGRLRVLLEDMVESGQWRLLWMPPTLPYLEPGGAYAEVEPFSKALVFSSWTVVPDAIAALCSYEVERRMVTEEGDRPSYSRLHRERAPLLRFTVSRGRLSGMPTLALMYPSIALSRAIDPLRLALEHGSGGPATLEAVRARATEIVEALLHASGAWPGSADGPEDQRWYWAALAILDRPHLSGLRRWLSLARGWILALSEREEDTGLARHIELFRNAADGGLDGELGAAPHDLVAVLVDLALAGPAVCAQRALGRVAAGLEIGDRSMMHAAAHVAAGFRSLYNLPESISLLRGRDEEVYWRRVLHYGIEGNLQSVLDEYAHFLLESLGLRDHEGAEIVERISRTMADALSLRTSRVEADDISVTRAGRIKLNRIRMRSRYALRYAELRDEQGGTLARAGTVQAAFNSPFRPFVLASTSIGQEGLDFHPYCHAVYHWNLPSNPVDLEQREGRVHRYKGYAVRKNVARRFGLSTLAERMNGSRDPWQVLFEAAAAGREPGSNDLVPFWIYPVPGGASVERRVPMFPFSREQRTLKELQRSLAVYRLAFGQPRQEDLLELLTSRAEEGGAIDIEVCRICLEPPEE